MGARQSKRSVDISGTPKKGGELENGSLATNVEEKLEKIAEADSAAAKVNANGSTTTTSTVTAEQQETAAAAAADSTTATPAESGEAPSEKTEVPSEQAEKAADVSTTTVEENKEEPSSPASPSENTPSSTEEGASSEKKKNKKKKWSFRSFSFSKKDKVKPASKEEKQQETLPEGNENTQSEQVNSAEANNVTPVTSEEPPPLPTSPPPTPADETSEKEETLTVSEAEIEASGGGEGLAEPIEEAELEDTKTSAPAPAAPVVEAPAVPAAAPAPVEEAAPVAAAPAAAPLTNGTTSQNGDYKEQNGKHAPEEEDEASPVHERKPSVDSVTAKIGSLKLQIASENSEQPAQNGVSDETATLNGVKETDVSSTENATAVATVEN